MGLWVEQLVAESLGKDGTGVVPDRGRAPRPARRLRRRPALPLPAPDRRARGGRATRRVVGGSDASAARHRPPGGHDGAGRRARRRRHRRPALRPARRRRRQGRHRRGARGGRRRRSRSSRSTTSSPSSSRATTSPSRRSSIPAPRVAARLEAARVGAARPAPRRHEPRLRPPVPPLHRAAPQGRPAADRVRPGRRRRPATRSPIPGQPFGFGHLKQAQAAGDLRTLQARGIRAGRVALDRAPRRTVAT